MQVLRKLDFSNKLHFFLILDAKPTVAYSHILADYKFEIRSKHAGTIPIFPPEFLKVSVDQSFFKLIKSITRRHNLTGST